MRKKKPVLVNRFCDELEKLRQAIEVLTGERVSFVCLDFNTRSGEILFAGNMRIKVVYTHSRQDLINFKLGTGSWCVATFDHNDGNIRVSSEERPNIWKSIDGHNVTMRWVGSSNRYRYEEPLFPYEREYAGKVRTATLNELVYSQP